MKRILYLIVVIVFSNNVVAQENQAVTNKLKANYEMVLYYNYTPPLYYVSKNGKQGACDITGKEIVPCQYSSVFRLSDNKYFQITIGNYNGVYDTKTQKEIIAPNKYTSIYKGISDCFDVKIGDFAGICDLNGKEIITPNKYTEVYKSTTLDYSYFQVKIGSFVGACDLNGKEFIAPNKYTSIYKTTQNYFDVKIGNFAGICDLNGKEIIAPNKYTSVSTGYNDTRKNYDHFDVKIGNLYGICDLTGKEIAPCIYETSLKYAEGLSAIKKDNKWGFIDISTGKIVVSIEYDEVTDFANGAAKVKKNGQYSMIPNPLIVQGIASSPKVKSGEAVSRYPAPHSDVDKDIPQSKTKNENLFAFIIANENYPEAPVPYALNDGRIFKEYSLKTLGLPQNNVKMFEDATVGRIIAAVEQIKEIANAYEGDAEIILYYAGHGVPDDKKSTAYLLPVDGSSSDITLTGYSLEKLYTELGKLKLKSITIFLDACFSGAKREDEMLASARGVAIKVKDEAPQGNMVVFSAATGDETAHQYEEKGHGLFTYFLLKKLQETQGNVNFGELSDFVTKQVKRQSVVINNKRQTPTVIPSVNLSDKWQEMKLK